MPRNFLNFKFLKQQFKIISIYFAGTTVFSLGYDIALDDVNKNEFESVRIKDNICLSFIKNTFLYLKYLIQEGFLVIDSFIVTFSKSLAISYYIILFLAFLFVFFPLFYIISNLLYGITIFKNIFNTDYKQKIILEMNLKELITFIDKKYSLNSDYENINQNNILIYYLEISKLILKDGEVDKELLLCFSRLNSLLYKSLDDQNFSIEEINNSKNSIDDLYNKVTNRSFIINQLNEQKNLNSSLDLPDLNNITLKEKVIKKSTKSKKKLKNIKNHLC